MVAVHSELSGLTRHVAASERTKKTHLFFRGRKKQQPYGGPIQETERVIAAKTNVFLPSTTAGKRLEFLLSLLCFS